MTDPLDTENLEILLVDDDEEDYLLTRDLLRGSNGGPRHVVHWAPGYDSGLEAAGSEDFDICLVDYRLGAQDGIDLVRELVSKYQDLPVIVLTGQGDHEVDIEAARAGADDYLVKGEVSAALLERAIRYAIKSRADLRALRATEAELRELNIELEKRVSARTIELAQTITELGEEKRRAEALYGMKRAVLDATVDCIQMVDLDGTPVLTNEAFDRVFKSFEVRSISGETQVLQSSLVELTTDPDELRETMESILADPEYTAIDEMKFVRSRRTFQRYTGPVRDVNGELIGRIYVLHEITAERETERLRSELITTVSHELRTPLTSILGYTEMIAEGEEFDHHHIELVHNAAVRLSHLVDDFFDLQRIEAGRFRICPEPFALDQLLTEQVELFSGSSAEHEIQLEGAAEPIVVSGERDRIAQVVGNLLSNAIKYSPGGGRVTVGAELMDDEACISITDSGIGISPDHQANVFGKFFRIADEKTRGIAGTGLGLAISKEIVEAHGGTVRVESDGPGRGSRFAFTLPLSS